MNRLTLIPMSLLVATLSAAPAYARAPGGFGLGLMIGDPTGITGALRSGDTSVIQAQAGWSTVHDNVHLNVDYLYNLAILNAPEAPNVSFPVYIGVGACLKLDDDNWYGDDEGVGVRVPLGLTILPRSAPLDFFLEVAPAVLILPETDVTVDGGVGARFYF